MNTNLVSAVDEPKSWNDVLNPKWKGKLAMDDPRGSGPGVPLVAEMTPLPKAVPHHVYDPTGRSKRVDIDDLDGYAFDRAASEADRLVFRRKAAA